MFNEFELTFKATDESPEEACSKALKHLQLVGWVCTDIRQEGDLYKTTVRRWNQSNAHVEGYPV
jgi:hypothetical protein